MQQGSRRLQRARVEEEIKDRPELRTFMPRAASPCLQEVRRQAKVSATTNWVGNCGCTCLCPGGPSK